MCNLVICIAQTTKWILLMHELQFRKKKPQTFPHLSSDQMGDSHCLVWPALYVAESPLSSPLTANFWLKNGLGDDASVFTSLLGMWTQPEDETASFRKPLSFYLFIFFPRSVPGMRAAGMRSCFACARNRDDPNTVRGHSTCSLFTNTHGNIFWGR